MLNFNLGLILFICSHSIIAQTSEYVYKNPEDSSYNCYLSIIPEHEEIKALIVRDFSSLPDTTKKSRYQWSKLALNEGIAILYVVSTNFFPELFYDDSGPDVLDNIIHEVINRHAIPSDNIFIGGISASGTRALRYTQYCEQGKSKHGIKIKGVFSVDSPLDLERFYNSAKTHKMNFSDGMLREAKLMTKVLPEKLGGTPDSASNLYHESSVFSYLDTLGGNASHYLNVPILLIHEPDIDWWLNERGASYFDMNSFDMAGFAAYLRTNGNNSIELITTSGKGFDKHGNRNCHSWTIVDEPYLINWIKRQL